MCLLCTSACFCAHTVLVKALNYVHSQMCFSCSDIFSSPYLYLFVNNFILPNSMHHYVKPLYLSRFCMDIPPGDIQWYQPYKCRVKWILLTGLLAKLSLKWLCSLPFSLHLRSMTSSWMKENTPLMNGKVRLTCSNQKQILYVNRKSPKTKTLYTVYDVRGFLTVHQTKINIVFCI